MLRTLIYGGRATLLVGAVAALLSVAIGLTIGAFAGYYGGKVDAVLMRITEFFQVLPALLFAMVLVTLFSPTHRHGHDRHRRRQLARHGAADARRVLRVQASSSSCSAERAIGAGNARIIWRVILPNALPPLIVSATLAVGVADPVRGRALASSASAIPNR